MTTVTAMIDWASNDRSLDIRKGVPKWPSPLNGGRPSPTFTDADREYVAEPLRVNGTRGAIRTCPFKISLKTVLPIARQYQIYLKPEQHPKRAA